MQPDNPFDPRPTGIDYLNQIATPPPSQGFNKKTKLLLFALAIIGVLSLVFIFTASQKSQGPSLVSLVARLQKLQTISTAYTPKLTSSKLQDAGSTLAAVLTTANKLIEAPAARQGLDIAKQQKAITALDPSTNLEKKLDDAYLNATLDEIYAFTIDSELADTLVMINRLKQTTRDKKTLEFFDKTVSDLSNVRKQLSVMTGSEK